MYEAAIVVFHILYLVGDAFKLLDITRKHVRFPVYLLMPHLVLLWSDAVIVNTLLIVCFLYTTVRLHFFTFRYSQCDNLRINVLYGGQLLIRFSLWGLTVQVLYYVLVITLTSWAPSWTSTPSWMAFLSFLNFNDNVILFWADAFVTAVFFLFLLANGTLRLLFTCYRLGILRRILIAVNLWIPVVNLFLMNYICNKAIEEYDGECCRLDNRLLRSAGRTCQTQYPFILLHGIGFRDLKHLNYWGRIARELTRNGAVLYYGHQEAWGTIERNSAMISAKINEVLAETGGQKVNIIAHSKGGLDARYLICEPGMAAKVASLTTICTPHRGSELISFLNKLPDGIYRYIASVFNRTFARIGDQEPDFYAATKQLSPEYCHEFNMKYPDAPEVYYQSYASVMNRFSADSLLSIPHLLMRFSGAGKNDGLVSEASAKWGAYRGTFVSTGRRGISHGDIIDLKREDYRGFDVLEEYIKIVQDLKEKGF